MHPGLRKEYASCVCDRGVVGASAEALASPCSTQQSGLEHGKPLPLALGPGEHPSGFAL